MRESTVILRKTTFGAMKVMTLVSGRWPSDRTHRRLKVALVRSPGASPPGRLRPTGGAP